MLYLFLLPLDPLFLSSKSGDGQQTWRFSSDSVIMKSAEDQDLLRKCLEDSYRHGNRQNWHLPHQLGECTYLALCLSMACFVRAQ